MIAIILLFAALYCFTLAKAHQHIRKANRKVNKIKAKGKEVGL